MTPGEPFRFYTERRLVRLTGRRARTLADLIRHVDEVSGSSIFYHTHHMFLSHHFLKPLFFNDFAVWAMDALQERELGERLAAIDLLEFPAIRPLREAILGAMNRVSGTPGAQERACPPGDEFHFCESQSFVVPTGLEAAGVPEFFAAVPHISTESLYYHFLEARLRLERPTNDFSHWLGLQGAQPLADAIDRLDPYSMTLDELKARIAALGSNVAGAAHGHPAEQL